MTVLIVDDQVNVVNGMLLGINWEKLSITQVLTANDALEARRIIASHDVDIMLCDIEMPGENGLSLYEWARDFNPKLECIFLTAHADFRYAQEAIKLRGFDYILQPAKYADVEEAIIRARVNMKFESDRDAHTEPLTMNAMKQMACDAALYVEATITKDEDRYIDLAVQYIQQNIDKNILRSDVAGKVNLNEDYLSRLFKKEFGMSIKSFIITEKMKTAQNLLRNTKLSISTIAIKVGFINFSHFSQIYKKTMGVLPTEDR